MTRDDWRAVFATAALIATADIPGELDGRAEASFIIADAMLAEWEKRREPVDERTETQRTVGVEPWCHAVMGKGETHWYCGNPRPCPEHDHAD